MYALYAKDKNKASQTAAIESEKRQSWMLKGTEGRQDAR
jgi:hypothetical protein